MSISRIQSGTSTQGTRSARGARASSASFAPTSVDAPQSPAGPAATSQAAGVSGPAGVAGIGAVLALQGDLTPDDAKRRAVERADTMLDALDEIQLALLSGGDGATALNTLAKLAKNASSATGDAGLDQLTRQVEIRAAVELAKREAAPETQTQIEQSKKASIYRPGSAPSEQGDRP